MKPEIKIHHLILFYQYRIETLEKKLESVKEKYENSRREYDAKKVWFPYFKPAFEKTIEGSLGWATSWYSIFDLPRYIEFAQEKLKKCEYLFKTAYTPNDKVEWDFEKSAHEDYFFEWCSKNGIPTATYTLPEKI